MKRLAAVVLIWAACAGAAAQTPNPVTAHYRAYQAALERGDLPEAARQAEAALAASEARDGDGGATAALAMNLATARFINDDAAGAAAAAQRAADLAAADEAAAGFSPVLPQLLIGRADLKLGRDAERLSAALEAAPAAGVPGEEIYDAALELGIFALGESQFALAREGWSIAADYAGSSRYPEAYARARAQVGAAAAAMLEDLNRTRARRGTLSVDGLEYAWRELSEAVLLLQPLAVVDPPSGEMSLAQSALAEALAWRAALRAKARTDRMNVPEYTEAEGDADGAMEVAAPIEAGQPRCFVSLRHGRGNLASLYPARALDQGALAGLTMRVSINAAGEVIQTRAVAVIGDDAFARAINNSRNRWTVVRQEDSPANCRMDMHLLVPVSFSLG